MREIVKNLPSVMSDGEVELILDDLAADEIIAILNNPPALGENHIPTCCYLHCSRGIICSLVLTLIPHPPNLIDSVQDIL